MYPRMQSISKIDETGIAKKEGLAISSPSTADCEALPFRAAPWIPGATAHPTAISSSLLGAGNYLVQADVSQSSITLGGTLEAGLFSATAGLVGKGLGDFAGSLGSQTLRIGSGDFYDPFTGSISSDSSNGLELLKSVSILNPTAGSWGSLVVDPFSAETANAGLSSLACNN